MQGFGDFFQMRQREPDFLAAGNDDAVGIKQPKAGERHVLGGGEIRRHARAESDESGSGGAAVGAWASGLGGSTLSLANSSLGHIG